MSREGENPPDQPPADMYITQEVRISPSGIDDSLGIWSRELIPRGHKFGPFEGERVQEAHADMDPSFVWEIADLETKEHLWYIDATDPRHGNWMRYIKSARFYEEQNIVSLQEGTDIYYTAIKDIEPDQELLTWYEKVQLKGTRRKRRKVAKKRDCHRSSTDTQTGTEEPFQTPHSDNDAQPHKKTKREYRKSLNNSKNSGIEKPRHNKQTRLSARFSTSDQTGENKPLHNTNKDKEPHDMAHESDESSSEDQDGFYRFEVKPEQEMKNKLGKKVYKCDICSAVYRHIFSLKRHYIRNHINIKYVSKADLLNCGISAESVATLHRKSESQEETNESQVSPNNVPESTNGSSEMGEDKISHKDHNNVASEDFGKSNADTGAKIMEKQLENTEANGNKEINSDDGSMSTENLLANAGTKDYEDKIQENANTPKKPTLLDNVHNPRPDESVVKDHLDDVNKNDQDLNKKMNKPELTSVSDSVQTTDLTPAELAQDTSKMDSTPKSSFYDDNISVAAASSFDKDNKIDNSSPKQVDNKTDNPSPRPIVNSLLSDTNKDKVVQAKPVEKSGKLCRKSKKNINDIAMKLLFKRKSTELLENEGGLTVDPSSFLVGSAGLLSPSSSLLMGSAGLLSPGSLSLCSDLTESSRTSDFDVTSLVTSDETKGVVAEKQAEEKENVLPICDGQMVDTNKVVTLQDNNNDFTGKSDKCVKLAEEIGKNDLKNGKKYDFSGITTDESQRSHTTTLENNNSQDKTTVPNILVSQNESETINKDNSMLDNDCTESETKQDIKTLHSESKQNKDFITCNSASGENKTKSETDVKSTHDNSQDILSVGDKVQQTTEQCVTTEVEFDKHDEIKNGSLDKNNMISEITDLTKDNKSETGSFMSRSTTTLSGNVLTTSQSDHNKNEPSRNMLTTSSPDGDHIISPSHMETTSLPSCNQSEPSSCMSTASSPDCDQSEPPRSVQSTSLSGNKQNKPSSCMSTTSLPSDDQSVLPSCMSNASVSSLDHSDPPSRMSSALLPSDQSQPPTCVSEIKESGSTTSLSGHDQSDPSSHLLKATSPCSVHNEPSSCMPTTSLPGNNQSEPSCVSAATLPAGDLGKPSRCMSTVSTPGHHQSNPSNHASTTSSGSEIIEPARCMPTTSLSGQDNCKPSSSISTASLPGCGDQSDQLSCLSNGHDPSECTSLASTTSVQGQSDPTTLSGQIQIKPRCESSAFLPSHDQSEPSSHMFTAAPSGNSNQSMSTSTPPTCDQQRSTPSNISPLPGLYRCNMCDVLYDTVADLKAHIQHHPPDSDLAAMVSCDRCDMKFTHKKNLMRHQAVHSASGPSKKPTCSYCGKTFSSSKNKKRHEKIHEGCRYTCEHCATSFTQSGDLKKHVRRQHPTCYHQCAYCPKYWPNKRELGEHLVTHGKTLAQNKEESTAKKGDEIQVIDPDLDKAESMKMVTDKYGQTRAPFKYACTVCRKLFVDYPNMCRHRSLAHQRHLLDVVKVKENKPKKHFSIMNRVSIIRTRAAAERESDEFYVNVADNIHDNLTNHMMGTQKMIDKAPEIIKWNVKSALGASSFELKREHAQKSNIVIPVSVLNRFNFPKSFKWRDPNSRFLQTPKRSSRSYSFTEGSMDIKEESSPADDSAKTDSTSDKDDKKSENKKDKKSDKALSKDISDKTKPKDKSSSSKDSSDKSEPQKDTTNNANDSSISSQRSDTVTPTSANDQCAKPSPPPSTVDSGAKPSRSHLLGCNLCHSAFHVHQSYVDHLKNVHRIDPTSRDNYIATQPKIITKQSHLQDLERAPPYISQNPKKILIPDIHVPVTLQHERPEQDLAVDLTHCLLPDLREVTAQRPIDLTRRSPPLLSPYGEDKSDDDSPDPTPAPEQIAALGLMKSPLTANRRVDVRAVCTEDPTEKYLRFLCVACQQIFSDWVTLRGHHEASHPTIEYDFSIIDPSLKQVWCRKPTPVGVLDICASQLPPQDYLSRQPYKCTKCSKRLRSLHDLHLHITECADPESLRPKYVWVYQYRKHKYSKLKKRTCEWQQNNNSPRKTPTDDNLLNIQGMSTPDKLDLSMGDSSLTTDIFDEISKKKQRRRPFELSYNPSRYTRRREMAEVVDSAICGGCGEDYHTITALERHIPVCMHKEKLRGCDSLRSVYEGTNESSGDSSGGEDYDPAKHLCIYCLRQFTYLGSLRKHTVGVCAVRREFVKQGEYLDQEWEDALILKTGGRREPLSRHSSVSSFSGQVDDDNSQDSADMRKPTYSDLDKKRRRKRRGFGWAQKTKGNGYTKTIKRVESKDGFVYEYYIESEIPVVAFDIGDTFILDADKPAASATATTPGIKSKTKELSAPYLHSPGYHHHHDDIKAEDLSKNSSRNTSQDPPRDMKGAKNRNSAVNSDIKDKSSSNRAVISGKQRSVIKTAAKNKLVKNKPGRPAKNRVGLVGGKSKTDKLSVVNGKVGRKRIVGNKTISKKLLKNAKVAKSLLTNAKVTKSLLTNAKIGKNTKVPRIKKVLRNAKNLRKTKVLGKLDKKQNRAVKMVRKIKTSNISSKQTEPSKPGRKLAVKGKVKLVDEKSTDSKNKDNDVKNKPVNMKSKQSDVKKKPADTKIQQNDEKLKDEILVETKPVVRKVGRPPKLIKNTQTSSKVKPAEVKPAEVKVNPSEKEASQSDVDDDILLDNEEVPSVFNKTMKKVKKVKPSNNLPQPMKPPRTKKIPKSMEKSKNLHLLEQKIKRVNEMTKRGLQKKILEKSLKKHSISKKIDKIMRKGPLVKSHLPAKMKRKKQSAPVLPPSGTSEPHFPDDQLMDDLPTNTMSNKNSPSKIKTAKNKFKNHFETNPEKSDPDKSDVDKSVKKKKKLSVEGGETDSSPKKKYLFAKNQADKEVTPKKRLLAIGDHASNEGLSKKKLKISKSDPEPKNIHVFDFSDNGQPLISEKGKIFKGAKTKIKMRLVKDKPEHSVKPCLKKSPVSKPVFLKSPSTVKKKIKDLESDIKQARSLGALVSTTKEEFSKPSFVPTLAKSKKLLHKMKSSRSDCSHLVSNEKLQTTEETVSSEHNDFFTSKSNPVVPDSKSVNSESDKIITADNVGIKSPETGLGKGITGVKPGAVKGRGVQFIDDDD